MALLLTACAATRSGEKIAVLDWQKTVEGHPLQQQLKLEEKQLKLLVSKRQSQEQLAKSQLASLSKLQGLKDTSERSFMKADYNTFMAEKEAIEQGKLISYTKQVGQESDALIADRRDQIEKKYQLEMFNLRLQLETLKMKPENRQALEQKLEQARIQRDQEMAQLNAEKQAYLQEKLRPYVEEMQKRLAEQGRDKNAELLEKRENSEEKYAKLMEAAPKALQNALAIMDREIEKQQQKCDALRKRIGKDIESQVVRLAKERGYTIVFNTFKANIKAEDITQEVIKALKAQK